MRERYGCKHCNFKGYVKNSFIGGGDNGEESVTVSVCSHCKDARGYYAYIRNKYGSPQKNNVVNLVEEEPMAKVLDFVEFKNKLKKQSE